MKRTEFELCQLKNELIERARNGEDTEVLAREYLIFRDGYEVAESREIQMWAEAFTDAANH